MIAALMARATPFLGWIKIGAVAALLAGLVHWHYRLQSNAVDAAKLAIRADYDNAARIAKEDADKRLSDQRAHAERTISDYIAAQAEYEKQLRTRQNALRKSTAALADCRLGRDVVRLLNDSRAGATRSDRPAVAPTGPALPNP